MPFVIVVVEAFCLTEHIMKPYPRRQIGKKGFSIIGLSRARQIVECTFGILVSKFRIFETILKHHQQHCLKTVSSMKTVVAGFAYWFLALNI